MQLTEIMTRDVATIAPDETLTAAAEKMSRGHVRALPVCEGRRVTGVVTDHDLVVKGLARHLDPEVTLVARCMREDVDFAYEDDDADLLLERMNSEQIDWMLVIDEDEDLLGTITTASLLRHSEERAERTDPAIPALDH